MQTHSLILPTPNNAAYCEFYFMIYTYNRISFLLRILILLFVDVCLPFVFFPFPLSHHNHSGRFYFLTQTNTAAAERLWKNKERKKLYRILRHAVMKIIHDAVSHRRSCTDLVL